MAVNIMPGKNRHSFTMESNGYRLLFEEIDDAAGVMEKGMPYGACIRVMSYDGNGEYAHFGLGKRGHIGCTSFANAVEQEMDEIKRNIDKTPSDIEYLEGKIRDLKERDAAMREMLSALPKIFLDDGVDKVE